MVKNLSLTVEILVAEQIGEAWSAWFDGLSIESDERGTRLMGSVADQAALYGLLVKLRDLGLSLIAVRVVEEGLD